MNTQFNFKNSAGNFLISLLLLSACSEGSKQFSAEQLQCIISEQTWKDTNGEYINAHGGCILHHDGIYYWYGEHRPAKRSSPQEGINCYSSTNLQNWQHEGIVLPVSNEKGHAIEQGCIMERPKVIYNEKTRKFVLYFHLELKGLGYSAARYGMAVSQSPTGPFEFIHSGRVNPTIWPLNMTNEERSIEWNYNKELKEWWTPRWYESVNKGLFTKRDIENGQMSRDMTLFVDTDGKAYHIYSSEENLTLQIAELSDDFLSHSGKYIRIAPAGHNEAPTLFKHKDTYWMITSGCTGWAPNAARMFSAPSIWGPWTAHENPCRGNGAEKTFGGQGTYVLTLGKDNFLFMADKWKPDSLMYSEYLWIPIQFDENNIPYLNSIN